MDVGKPKIVVSLLRASTDQQDLDTQRTNIEFYCLPEQFNLKVVDSFIFPGITGTVVHKTPEFQRMLKRLSDPALSGGGMRQVDRMMRVDELDAFGSLKMFRTHRKLIYCDVSHPLDVTNPEDRQAIANKLIEAGNEKRRIFFRTNRAKERLIQNPQISITRLPQGVRHDITPECRKQNGAKSKIGVYSYTPYAYEKVLPAFERYAKDRESLNAIATSLGFKNESSLRTVLENKWWIGYRVRDKKRLMTYDEETGAKKFSKRMQHETVIDQPTNLAETPLVSVELFGKVQAILAKSKTEFTMWQSNTGSFLGTPFLRCQCGCKLYLKFDKRNGQPPVYVCSSYMKRWQGRDVPKCKFSRVRAERMDQIIWQMTEKIFKSGDYLELALERAKDSAESKAMVADVDAARKVLEDLEKQKTTFVKLIRRDPEDEDLQRELRDIKRAIADQKIRLATVEAEAQPFGSTDSKVIAAVIQNRFKGSETWDMEQKRQALIEVVERLRVGYSIDDYGERRETLTFVVRGGLRLDELAGFDQLLMAEIGEMVEVGGPNGETLMVKDLQGKPLRVLLENAKLHGLS